MIRKIKASLANISPIFDQSVPFDRKETDFHLVSFPKSGNTWLRHLIADAMIKHYDLKLEINDATFNHFVPDKPRLKEIVNSDIQAKLMSLNAPRIYKSHNSYNRYFSNVILLIRDPKDVMVSYYFFHKARQKDYHGTFSEFIRTKEYGIQKWFKHIRSWLDNYHFLLSYEELLERPVETLKKLLVFVGLTGLTDSEIQELIDNNTIKKLRVKNTSFNNSESYNFFRKGKSGDWVNNFTDEDLEYFKAESRLYEISELPRNYLLTEPSS